MTSSRQNAALLYLPYNTAKFSINGYDMIIQKLNTYSSSPMYSSESSSHASVSAMKLEKSKVCKKTSFGMIDNNNR